ncbi:MAG: alpha/beta fold hydrolase [Lautropia sp.]
MSTAFIDVAIEAAIVTIEHRWLARERADAPLVVFLHEGLGSVSSWRDFPQRLVDAAGCSGLVFSRPGYGRSAREPGDLRWDNGYLHRQALTVVPAVLAALAKSSGDSRLARPWLLGHSDGGSIALIIAAQRPGTLAGAIVLAPHIIVEQQSVAGIAAARDAYREGSLRTRLARHHDDPDFTFWRWNDVWLSPPFRAWSIERELPAIRCPLLAIQGTDDAYGTMAQIDGIVARVPGAEAAELADCGHSLHRDQPQRLVDVCAAFLRREGSTRD